MSDDSTASTDIRMNNPLPRRVALAFMAHPDDAEILCAGTLLRLRDIGWDVHIVTATSGDCGSAALPASEIAEIRRGEAMAAAELMGAVYHCVGESDVNVVFDQPTNRKVIDLFRQIAPTLVFTHPRHDYMLDHEQVHLLARSAAFSYPILNASKLPLRDGSAIPYLYYCDPIEAKDPYSGTAVVPTTYVEISRCLDRKISMLSCHASQRDWLRAHHGIDEYIEAMKRHAEMRGRQIDRPAAEAFIQHRGHAFPPDDLLTNLFAKE